MTDDVYALSFVSIPAGTSVPGCEQTNSCFLPYSVTVNIGDQVIWSNDDTEAHTVTSNDGSFDSSLFMAGTGFSHTFSQAGTYPYLCMVHPWMTGVVNVQGAPSIEYYSLQVSVSPSTVLEDEMAVISGQLYASQYISGYVVSVQFETDTGLSGGQWILDGGQFNTNVVWPVGVHTITYYFESDAGTLVSNSVVLTVKTPDLPGTIIILDPSISSITTDQAIVSFSGQLLDENGIPISGKMIIVQGDSDNGRGQSKSAVTDSSGYFIAELNFSSEYDVANWTIYAKFEGDSEYKKSSSNTRQLAVTSAPTPEDNCDPSYPEVCIPVYPPDLDCGEIQYANFKVLQPDPHGFDGDKDGIGCESTPTPPPPAPAGTDVQITLGSSVPGCEDTNSCYSPYTISVDVGDTVTWYNADTTFHTVTSGNPADGPDGVFDSSLFMSGTSFSHTFSQAGTYSYFDMTLPWMSGVVIVGPVVEEGLMMSLTTVSAIEGESMVIEVGFHDLIGNNVEHVNYDIMATQGSQTVLDEKGVHDHDGVMTHTTMALVSSEIVNISIFFNGFGIDTPFTGPIGQVASFQVVPEPKSEPEPVCGPGTILKDGVCVVIDTQQVVVAWDEPTYKICNTGVITIQAAEENISPNLIQIFFIQVTSDSDPVGVEVVMVETGIDTGVFTGDLQLCGELSVSEGDKVYATYGNIGDTATIESSTIAPAPPGTDVVVPLGSSVPGCEQTDSCWIPSTISVNVGDTVTWYNADTAAHTVTSGTSVDPPSAGAVFDSSLFMSGTSFSHTFSQAGEYPYFCIVHPWMTGLVLVEGKIISQSDAGTLQINADRFTISKYNPAEVILSGLVSAYTKGTPVWLQLIFPDGSVLEQKILVSSAKNFGISIFLDDTYPTGSYTITAQYNSIDFTPISFQAVAEKDTTVTSISVSTDRSSYSDGNTIIITGEVGEILSGYQVTIQVFEPSFGHRVYVNQVSVEADRTFSDQITAGGLLWESFGTYTVKVLYGTEATSAEATFTFTTSVPPPPPPGTDVIIPIGSSIPGCEETNSCWIPSTISVDVGDTVTWYNADTAAHTITSGSPGDGPDGTFDSNMLMSGETFEVTFTQDGTYPYFCMVHPWQVGTVIVGGGGPIASTISVSTDRSSYTTDDTVIVSGSVSQIIENIPITITITNPEGQIVTLGQFTPSSDGTYSASFNTGGPVWELSGTHTVRVQYGTTGSDTTFMFTAVPKISASVLVLDPLPTKVNRGDLVLMTGRLHSESGIPIPFRTINIVSDNNGEIATSTTTDSIGEFAVTWSVAYSYNTYRWYAEFTGDNQFTPSNSAVQSVSIILRPDLYFTPLPNRVDEGTTLEFSGQLTAEGLPLAGKTIYIKDDVDFGTDTNLGSVITDQNGEFSATWDAVPRSSGAYDFYAVFEGDLEVNRVRSATYSVYVTITQILEPVRVNTEETIFSEGDDLVVYGTATPNEELEIALLDANENIVTRKSIRVDSTGSYRTTLFTWQSSSNVNFGDYRVVAWSPIDKRYDFTWVSFIKSEPIIYQTEIILNRPPSTVTLYGQVTFTGQLQTIDGQPLAFTPVGIATITNQVPETLQIGTTDSSGSFSITWTLRYTSSSATIPVYAYFGGNQVFDHSTSGSYNITIERPSLSLFTEKTSYKAGELLIAYGYGSPGDTINVSLRSQQGQIMSNSVKVASDGSYLVFFDLIGISQGSYTVTATSSSFGITDSTTIFVEAKEILEAIDIVGDVYFSDQGRKVPLGGIKAVLDIGASQRVDYVDSSGKFEFNNINFNSRVSYLIHFEMTDGKSFNFIDSQLYSTSASSPPVIKSRTMLLNIDETLATNHFAINLGLNMPSSYSNTDAYYINKAFDLQNKIVEFYNRVLNEKPPMINIFLFESGSSYRPAVWNPETGNVESTYQPRIRLDASLYDMWSGIGMEYTHYVQDFSYKKMHGYDNYPRNGNHFGYNNPSTADSWTEGVGTFMPAIIADWYNMAEAGTFSKTSLERNDYKPTTSYKKWSSYWLDEEYSIATLLWDLYDRSQDGENISLSITEVWRLIEGFDDFQKYNSQDYMKKYSYSEQIADNERHIKYFKDFYDYMSDYDVNHDGRIDSGDQRLVDEVFALHGIPNGYTDSGRTRV